jgi:hypothetical protein
MEPVPTDTGGAVTSTGEVIKERVRQMYSRSAEAYVTSPPPGYPAVGVGARIGVGRTTGLIGITV